MTDIDYYIDETADDDFDDGDDLLDCALDAEGYCGHAGTEQCDFECPLRDSEYFRGSDAWMKARAYD
jgi:hypothetical protein